jgi:hypothetical protein
LAGGRGGKINLFRSLRQSTHVYKFNGSRTSGNFDYYEHGSFPEASASTAPQQQLIPSLVENNNNYYQNAMDGFRVQIPEGWVMDDIDNTGLAALAVGEQLGQELLAIVCPQDQALRH